MHIEPTHDANSWERREKRFMKKFSAGRKYLPTLFNGVQIPNQIEQICLLGFGSNANHKTLASGKVVKIVEFLVEIIREIGTKSMHKSAMSENHPILRTLQFITQNKKHFSQVLADI